ncbi:MAG: GntR family transcriptional regulator [Candidatus Sumerlaeia bacterium]|nr:GntR family transcriptional regulator [Candidatus Sumerlaeia bacterium]
MLFQIDLHSTKPVYQQLVDQVKQAIATNRLRAGDRLPPIRDLAAELCINRNTIAKVYSELEREGLLYSRAGQGSFVSDKGTELSNRVRREQLTERIDELLTQARLFSYTQEQIEELIRKRLDRYYRNTNAPQESKE